MCVCVCVCVSTQVCMYMCVVLAEYNTTMGAVFHLSS